MSPKILVREKSIGQEEEIMTLPKDPIMLLSYVNTQLRDHYDSLEAFCSGCLVDAEDVKKKLAAAGYIYDRELNRFRQPLP